MDYANTRGFAKTVKNRKVEFLLDVLAAFSIAAMLGFFLYVGARLS